MLIDDVPSFSGMTVGDILVLIVAQKRTILREHNLDALPLHDFKALVEPSSFTTIGEFIEEYDRLGSDMRAQKSAQVKEEEKLKEKDFDDFLWHRDGVILTDLEISDNVLRLIPNPDVLLMHSIFPVVVINNKLFIAIDASKREEDVDKIHNAICFLTGYIVESVSVPGEHIKSMLVKYFPQDDMLSCHGKHQP